MKGIMPEMNASHQEKLSVWGGSNSHAENQRCVKGQGVGCVGDFCQRIEHWLDGEAWRQRPPNW